MEKSKFATIQVVIYYLAMVTCIVLGIVGAFTIDNVENPFWML